MIDARSIVPFNYEKVIESVKKTRKILLTSDACERGSALQTFAAKITQFAFDELDAPAGGRGRSQLDHAGRRDRGRLLPAAVGHPRRGPRAHSSAQGLHAGAGMLDEPICCGEARRECSNVFTPGQSGAKRSAAGFFKSSENIRGGAALRLALPRRGRPHHGTRTIFPYALDSITS